MRVVVTGAAGFIGSHTVERLIQAGHEVIGIDAFDDYLYEAKRKQANAAKLISLPRFALIDGDICDPSVLVRAISSADDVVCHLAALAGVRPSLNDPQRYMRTNIIGTQTVLEQMRATGARRLVFGSSSSVYGVMPEAAGAFCEDDPCLRPASPYAATKRMNELQLSTYRDLFGIGAYALRFFTVYGPRQRPDMAISRFLSAVGSGEPIKVFGDGSSRRDYTFVDDIVSGVVAGIERVTPGAFEIINLGGTRTTSLGELVSLVEETVGRSAIIERMPLQPGDVPITFANIERARQLLAFEPATGIATGIAHQWRWMQGAT